MIINFLSAGTSSKRDIELVKHLIRGMCEEYCIGFSNSFHVIMSDHRADLCEWIMKKYNIEATPVKLGTLCNGIRLNECAELTAILLKL